MDSSEQAVRSAAKRMSPVTELGVQLVAGLGPPSSVDGTRARGGQSRHGPQAAGPMMVRAVLGSARTTGAKQAPAPGQEGRRKHDRERERGGPGVTTINARGSKTCRGTRTSEHKGPPRAPKWQLS